MKTALIALGLSVGLGLSEHPRQAPPVPLDWSGPPGSGKPFLTRASGNKLLLTWFEPRPGKRHALRLAIRSGLTWSEPRTVAESDRFFVNWADFPSVVETDRGMLVVHWLEKTAEKAYAYHVRLSTSRDQGRSWSAPITAHADRSPTEHGFVAMVPTRDGGAAVTWLDGGAMTDSAGTMSVRSATLRADGTMYNEQVIDRRTCECCQVAMTRTASGLIAAYRERSDTEVRDIAVARELGGRWSAPSIVAHDNWVWKACPVNGPSIAAVNNNVGVAWFTAANAEPRAKVAFSTDGGVTFGQPTVIDEGNPLGRVHLQLAQPASALVVWLEAKGETAFWMVRRVTFAGGSGPSKIVAETSRARDGGFARTAVLGDDLFVAWTDQGGKSDSSQVRVARIKVSDVK
jgi:BNR repeat-like domain